MSLACILPGRTPMMPRPPSSLTPEQQRALHEKLVGADRPAGLGWLPLVLMGSVILFLVGFAFARYFLHLFATL